MPRPKTEKQMIDAIQRNAKKLIERSEKSLTMLAEEAGIPLMTYWGIVARPSRKSTPSHYNLSRVAASLGVSVDELIDG